MPTKPIKIRRVAAFRLIYKCGHRGTVVAQVRGKRAAGSARKRAERLTEIPCLECEQEELERERLDQEDRDD